MNQGKSSVNNKSRSTLIASLDPVVKILFSYAVALLVSVGLSLSMWISLLDKDFESKKEIIDLMYLQERMQMNAEEFIKDVAKKDPQKYCSTILNLDSQKICRLTLYKNHEINWWQDKIALYILFSSIVAFSLLSMACYRLTRPIFRNDIFSWVAAATLFSALYILFLLVITSDF